jgi:hypothetical protein
MFRQLTMVTDMREHQTPAPKKSTQQKGQDAGGNEDRSGWRRISNSRFSGGHLKYVMRVSTARRATMPNFSFYLEFDFPISTSGVLHRWI